MHKSTRKSVTLKEALDTMKSLNDEPENPDTSDYRRGQLDLVACLFGVDGMPTDERMDEIAKKLGWPKVI